MPYLLKNIPPIKVKKGLIINKTKFETLVIVVPSTYCLFSDLRVSQRREAYRNKPKEKLLSSHAAGKQACRRAKCRASQPRFKRNRRRPLRRIAPPEFARACPVLLPAGLPALHWNLKRGDARATSRLPSL